jgi:hypothetical protein
MKPLISMREALSDPALLGHFVEGDSWATWRALLIASRGEPLTNEEMELYRERTGRIEAPTAPVEEMAFIAGRRSGKTVTAACLSLYLSALCDWSDVLRRGERGVMLFLAQSQKTARVAFRYAESAFDENPYLAQLVENKTQETISLRNGVDLEIRPASFRSIRGITLIGSICDELAFWYSNETSANPDSEVLAAIRPALSTTRGPLCLISSPYAQRGELWEIFRRHHGPEGDPGILVAQGGSLDFNPLLPEAVVKRAISRDPARARSEYLGVFRTDVTGYIPREAVEACIEPGVRERPPSRQFYYVAFVDPSGGSSDSMTLAIAHKEANTVILDAVREVAPPFSPEAVVAEFAHLLKSYRISTVQGDKYGGEWPREVFRKEGVFYEPTASPKSDLYRDMLPLINSRAVDLLDCPRLVDQLTGLERRTGTNGRDTIDHPQGGHDDLANAVAGAVVLATKESGSIRKPEPKFIPRNVA